MVMIEGWRNAGKWLGLVLLMALAAGIPAAAGQATVTASSGEPVDAAGWYELGNAYINQGRLDGALHALDRAIALDPSFARAYFVKGQVLAKLGLHTDALDAYETAISLDPGLASMVDSYRQASENLIYPKILSGSLIAGSWVPGNQYLVIDNRGGTSDVVVALAPTGVNAATAAVYIRKGYINAFDAIVLPGEFTFFITSGERWNAAANKFDKNARYIKWTPPQYTYGSNGFGYTLVFVGQQTFPNWYVNNLQQIPQSAFPAL